MGFVSESVFARVQGVKRPLLFNGPFLVAQHPAFPRCTPR